MSKIKFDGEFLNHGMLKNKSESAYDNHMVNAHGRPSTEHTSQRRKAALRFNAANMFGAMGKNPSINALTNANAMASQQPFVGGSMIAKPDMSQQIMTGSFDPLTQQIGMGIFGDQNARNMAVRGSGLMMSPMLKALGSEPNVDPCSAEFDYEIATDAGHSAEDIKKYREANCKSGSPAQNKGETYEEFKQRTGETSMKAYMRDNPTGSKK